MRLYSKRSPQAYLNRITPGICYFDSLVYAQFRKCIHFFVIQLCWNGSSQACAFDFICRSCFLHRIFFFWSRTHIFQVCTRLELFHVCLLSSLRLNWIYIFHFALINSYFPVGNDGGGCGTCQTVRKPNALCTSDSDLRMKICLKSHDACVLI